MLEHLLDMNIHLPEEGRRHRISISPNGPFIFEGGFLNMGSVVPEEMTPRSPRAVPVPTPVDPRLRSDSSVSRRRSERTMSLAQAGEESGRRPAAAGGAHPDLIQH